MSRKKIALIGNPNVGKTSIFNLLTGENQKTGNYSGVTVTKGTASFQSGEETFELIDLPGTYSLYPNSKDEQVVLDLLLDVSHSDFPDTVGVVANGTDLKKSLLLLGQIADMGFKVCLTINQIDEVKRRKIQIDVENLSRRLTVPVIAVSTKSDFNSKKLQVFFTKAQKATQTFFEIPSEFQAFVKEKRGDVNINLYSTWQQLLRSDPKENNSDFPRKWHSKRLKILETVRRYKNMEDVLESCVKHPDNMKNTSNRLDRILMHPILGYFVFGALLLLVFQAIYSWSGLPMDWIDGFINGAVVGLLETELSEGPLKSLLTEGILPGISGIIIFVPQIVLLFFFLLFLEESGYMSRVIFLMDKWVRPFGLSGKSVVPLISGMACAVPAIMAARSIESKKERLITILVTPFVTCSARLPVYAIVIALIIPSTSFFGIRIQALSLFVLYLFGIVMALLSAVILKIVLKNKRKTYLVMELPSYQWPDFKRLLKNLWERVWSFLWGAGRIIFALSILIWMLSKIGWNEEFRSPEKFATATENAASVKLQNSVLGLMGKAIEPALEPLGYDWKIGIAIITSFAAREVFVGTLSTLYSLNDEDSNSNSIIEKMNTQVNLNTGKKLFNLASGISLLLFYALAMQCMSTVAIVKQETGSWKWASFQFVSMSVLAYVFALTAYQILS